MVEAIKELVGYAPFGAFCLILLWIQHRSNVKAQDSLEKSYNKSLEIINNNQTESLKILKDAQNIGVTEKLSK